MRRMFWRDKSLIQVELPSTGLVAAYLEATGWRKRDIGRYFIFYGPPDAKGKEVEAWLPCDASVSDRGMAIYAVLQTVAAVEHRDMVELIQEEFVDNDVTLAYIIRWYLGIIITGLAIWKLVELLLGAG